MSTSANLVYNLPWNFRIGQTPPVGIPDELITPFQDLYNAFQQVFVALNTGAGIGSRPTQNWGQLAGTAATLISGNANRFYVLADEDIVLGAAVALNNAAGVLHAVNANATNNTRQCRGFCSTPGGIANGAVGEVILAQGIASIGSLTPGTSYYLSTSNGLISPTPAVAAGNIEQYLGFAIDANDFLFNVGTFIQH